VLLGFKGITIYIILNTWLVGIASFELVLHALSNMKLYLTRSHSFVLCMLSSVTLSQLNVELRNITLFMQFLSKCSSEFTS